MVAIFSLILFKLYLPGVPDALVLLLSGLVRRAGGAVCLLQGKGPGGDSEASGLSFCGRVAEGVVLVLQALAQAQPAAWPPDSTLQGSRRPVREDRVRAARAAAIGTPRGLSAAAQAEDDSAAVLPPPG